MLVYFLSVYRILFHRYQNSKGLIAGNRPPQKRKYTFFPLLYYKRVIPILKVFIYAHETVKQTAYQFSQPGFQLSSLQVCESSGQATILALFARAIEGIFLLCIVNMAEILQLHIFIQYFSFLSPDVHYRCLLK